MELQQGGIYMRRRYQKVQELLPEIKRMLESGMSQREVAERLGLEGDRPIHDLLKRERKKATTIRKPSFGSLKNTASCLKFGENASGRPWGSKFINIRIYSTGNFMQTDPTANG